ncbi:MLO-like protein 1 [Cucumis melo var. makuwa]|uniref:MLO-like protein n=1 Tax=Cucumis melo var. makuwa TaxID=1194695 RepID=A0A5A7TEM5_CUCMM|nr:MLO-like protein 1 [Cucumis melo var. makuwa]
MGGGGEGTTLEFTPTWVVAAVCTVIVAISLALERLLHFLGRYLKSKNQKPLNEALQKVKEELMLLGFISLLLTVFQGTISKLCVPESLTEHLLPCDLKDKPKAEHGSPSGETGSSTTKHFRTFFVSSISGTARRLLAEGSASQAGYCAKKNKVPLLSLEALHHLHIFIFILAIVHVTFCVLTVVFGGLKIRQWKHWEDSIAKENYDTEQVVACCSDTLYWVFLQHSFLKQFYASVTKSDYATLRLGFIMTHCRGNPKFNFHKYMIRALEDDFKHVVGIRQVIFETENTLLFLAAGFLYFVALLLAVGTKLEHVITQLAHEVAEKHVAIEGDLVVQPSDDHFWFQRPRIVLFLIHFILFQNAFEIGFFFWIWVQYGFDSCIMGQVRYIIPRLIIGVFVQVLCSYSTLPLYAIVTQMGSSFKKAIFDEHVQVGLVGWAQKVKKRKGLRAAADGSSQGVKEGGSTVGIQLGNVMRKASAPQEIKPDDSKSNDLP